MPKLKKAESGATKAAGKTTTPAMPAVAIGVIVRYTMDSGQIRPAIVVRGGNGEGTVNLVVFVDGQEDGYGADRSALWKFRVPYSAKAEPGTWHWG